MLRPDPSALRGVILRQAVDVPHLLGMGLLVRQLRRQEGNVAEQEREDADQNGDRNSIARHTREAGVLEAVG
eukprot:10495426-Alexandrium_andersonii.AAC.1